nr:MAG TPA: hypothetical protein [Caudoviricetes sp.]
MRIEETRKEQNAYLFCSFLSRVLKALLLSC